MAAALLILAVALGSAGPAAARPTQDGLDTSTTTVTDASAVTTTIPSTTTTGGGEISVAEGGPGSAEVAAENRKIWAVVAALVAVAIALTLLTIRYWRQTRPARPASSQDDRPEPVLPPAELAVDEEAVEDEAFEVDEPVVVVPAIAAAEAASVAPSIDDLEDELFAPPTLEVPVVVPGVDPLAGMADDDADESWARRTGEHRAVVAPDLPRIVRPTPDQRRAAFAAAADRPD